MVVFQTDPNEPTIGTGTQEDPANQSERAFDSDRIARESCKPVRKNSRKGQVRKKIQQTSPKELEKGTGSQENPTKLSERTPDKDRVAKKSTKPVRKNPR
ncbi:hypothetical protein HPT25_17440 [Bacillus sp. BRMEA1]|uniref:hypothetical protein n=1 Tax=Neobacillus endophyticus TaxID=2738405 RepID=UPI00156635E9|nr:hypothetical protein [Neobacillus endophyticus]NRD79144.1 hypothetical protein [Neobacillus endophyticus]